MGEEQRYETMTMKSAPGRHRTFHAGRTDHEPSSIDSFRVPGTGRRSADARRGQVRVVQLEARAEGLLPRRLEPRLVHLQRFKAAERSEDHLARLACNVWRS